MGQLTAGIALLLVAGTGTSAGPVRLLHHTGWPDPIPASSVEPLNWSTIHPPIYGSQWSLSSSSFRPSNKDPNAQPLKSSISVTDTPLPNIVDWRNRDGVNYITTPQDQGVCNSCWAFATTALVEAMVRIEHGVWTKRSEADVHSGVGALCADYGSADEALAWMAGMPQPWDQQHLHQNPPGIADWACGPYEDRDPTIRTRCADRDGRATHVPPFQALGTMEDQKRWLDRYGPLVATFVLYSDFGTWRPMEKGTVYQWDGMKDSVGNHLALVVGYDDNKQAWIIKNSWGKQWGEDGFAYIA
jgi:C1A family cysteine protease